MNISKILQGAKLYKQTLDRFKEFVSDKSTISTQTIKDFFIQDRRWIVGNISNSKQLLDDIVKKVVIDLNLEPIEDKIGPDTVYINKNIYEGLQMDIKKIIKEQVQEILSQTEDDDFENVNNFKKNSPFYYTNSEKGKDYNPDDMAMSHYYDKEKLRKEDVLNPNVTQSVDNYDMGDTVKMQLSSGVNLIGVIVTKDENHITVKESSTGKIHKFDVAEFLNYIDEVYASKKVNEVKKINKRPIMKPNKKTEDDKTIETIRKNREKLEKDSTKESKVTDEILDKIASKLGINWVQFNKAQFKKGVQKENKENEYTFGNLILVSKIVVGNLKSNPDYYKNYKETSKKLVKGITTMTKNQLELKEQKLRNLIGTYIQEVLVEKRLTGAELQQRLKASRLKKKGGGTKEKDDDKSKKKDKPKKKQYNFDKKKNLKEDQLREVIRKYIKSCLNENQNNQRYTMELSDKYTPEIPFRIKDFRQYQEFTKFGQFLTSKTASGLITEDEFVQLDNNGGVYGLIAPKGYYNRYIWAAGLKSPVNELGYDVHDAGILLFFKKEPTFLALTKFLK